MVCIKVIDIYIKFSTWENGLIWASGKIILLLWFELKNNCIKSWSLHECFRPICYLFIKVNHT